MAKEAKIEPSLEAKFETLSAIIKQLETGDIPLEEALAQFESGIALLKNCQEILENAEQKIKKLTEDQSL